MHMLAVREIQKSGVEATVSCWMYCHCTMHGTISIIYYKIKYNRDSNPVFVIG
jgi:hypothetical protein